MKIKIYRLALFWLTTVAAAFGIMIALSRKASAAENNNGTARSISLGNASVTLSDAWSTFHNQAALARLEAVNLGFGFDNRFGISNLSTGMFALAVPTKAGAFGISTSVFGYSAYRETKAGIAYAKSFSEKIAVGLQLNYFNTFINDEFYGTKSTFLAEGGILAEPFKNLLIGFHVFNPTRAKLAGYADERISTVLRLGASYRFSKKVMWSIEQEKDIDYKAVFKSGIEYHISEPLYIRGGLSTNPSLFSFGFGLRLKNFSMDAASSYHQVLGFSPAASLNYAF